MYLVNWISKNMTKKGHIWRFFDNLEHFSSAQWKKLCALRAASLLMQETWLHCKCGLYEGFDLRPPLLWLGYHILKSISMHFSLKYRAWMVNYLLLCLIGSCKKEMMWSDQSERSLQLHQGIIIIFNKSCDQSYLEKRNTKSYIDSL